MTRDYAKKPRKTTRKSTRSNNKKSEVKRSVPGWVWLFTGTILGAFIMFLIELSTVDLPTPSSKPQANVNSSKNNKSDEAKESKEPQEPLFNFYERLKMNEVPVREGTKPASQQVNPDKDKYEDLLQVASFRKLTDAEELRIKLLLLNMDASIESGKGRNGDTWHRVIVGPFSSRSKLAKARSTLVSNNYEALRLRRAKPEQH